MTGAGRLYALASVLISMLVLPAIADEAAPEHAAGREVYLKW
jgi:hypothetical protein